MTYSILPRILMSYLGSNSGKTYLKGEYRPGWSKSVILSEDKLHSRSEKGNGIEELFRKKKYYDWFRKTLINLSNTPRLEKPIDEKKRKIEPPRFFSKGDLDRDLKKNLEPNRNLLTENYESLEARLVPENTRLLRSLCKGRGKLRKNAQGLIYLDVDDRFIDAMQPYLSSRRLLRPPYFETLREPNGAHIPIISSREYIFHYMGDVKEVGEEFTFEIRGLYSVKPTFWPEVEEVWFFEVYSPQAERLRTKYFLTELPNGHPFHLAVAIKKKPALKPKNLPHIMRINPAVLIA